MSAGRPGSSLHQPHGSRTASPHGRPRRFRSVLGWTVLNAVLPGTGLIAAGRRLAGAVVLGIFLALLGIVGARTGGASPRRPALRVLFWGAAAMAATAAIGHLVGRAV